jgi:glycosyltransferase involved in cell wall biosynthesis
MDDLRPAMSIPDNLWVLIPAFNEGEVIGRVVADVRGVYPRVLVVDDCSHDNTGREALAAGATVLRHPINLGQGASLQTGLRYALANGAEYIVTFDADGQHRVDDIAVLSAKGRETGVDVVLGSRFLGSAENIPPSRRALLKLAILFARMTSGTILSDAHNGLRLFTRHAAERIKIRQNRMAHASEIVDQITTLGLSVSEAPVTIVYTEYSLRKGQRISNAINVLAELFVARLNK